MGGRWNTVDRQWGREEGGLTSRVGGLGKVLAGVESYRRGGGMSRRLDARGLNRGQKG